MKKVQAETRILTDCLAQTKVSNVIKENSDLENDHSQGCLLLNKINNGLKKELLSGEIINNYITDSRSNTKNNFRKSLRSLKNIDD